MKGRKAHIPYSRWRSHAFQQAYPLQHTQLIFFLHLFGRRGVRTFMCAAAADALSISTQ